VTRNWDRWSRLEGLLPSGGIGNIGYGASYAARHVAGLLALLLESEPEQSPTAQRDRLLESCRKRSRIPHHLRRQPAVTYTSVPGLQPLRWKFREQERDDLEAAGESLQAPGGVHRTSTVFRPVYRRY
jgi:hypothetical protein